MPPDNRMGRAGNTFFCAKILPLFLGLSALEGFISFGYLLSLPTDQKNSVLFGYSIQRLAIAIGVVLVAAILAALAVKYWRFESQGQRVLDSITGQDRWFYPLVILAVLCLVTGWTLLAMPAYRFGDMAAYIERLQPVIIWLCLISLQALLLVLVYRFGLHWSKLKEYILSHTSLAAGGISIGILALMGWLIASTGLGIVPDARFWGNIGTPLLAMQIFLTWCFLVCILGGILYLSRRIKNKTVAALVKRIEKVDIFICLGLWIITAVMWAREPALHSFFLIDPLPPNNEPYPFSDARYYDSSAQFMLIGEKLGGGGYITRPWYIFFLAILTAIAGPHYNSVITLQVVLFAILPAVLYLIGKMLNGRLTGLVVAIFAFVKELNAIRSTPFIQVSHSKLMLADFPTTVGVALFTLLFIHWLKAPARRLFSAIAAGGVFGIMLMVRFHVVTLLPLAMFVALIVLRKSLRSWLQGALLMLVSVALCVLPWMYRNWSVMGRFVLEGPQIRTIVNQRYRPTATPRVLPQSPEVVSTVVPDVIATPTSAPASGPVATATPRPTPTPKPRSEAEIAAYAVRMFFDSNVKAVYFIVDHFFHNLLLTVRELPTSWVYDDLPHTLLSVPSDEDNWDGSIPPGEIVLWVVNLAFLVIGIATTIRRVGFMGIIPLFMLAGYSLSSALTRVSGWRYILPADWAIYLYFGIGLVEFTLWLAVLLGADYKSIAPLLVSNVEMQDDVRNKRPPVSLKTVLLVFGCILLIGSSIVIVEAAISKRYTVASKPEVITSLLKNEALNLSAADIQIINSASENPSSEVLVGRALYPIYFTIGHGVPGADGQVFKPQAYPRLLFSLIGSRETTVVFPAESPPAFFPNASDVIVLGCREKGTFQAIFVVVTGEENAIYIRSPQYPLECIQ